MNNICKVVWSHARQQFVAVSEVTSANGKAQSVKSGSSRRSAWAAGALAIAASCGWSAAQAQVDVRLEAPGVFNSTATFDSNGRYVQDFNSASLGANTGLAIGSVATITGGQIVPHNAYGGAPVASGSGFTRTDSGSYITASAVSPVTITFTTPQNYFGIWLSAINNGNVVTVYGNDADHTVLQTFDALALNTLLSAANYTGARLTSMYGLSPSFSAVENFGFLNFYGTNNTLFGSVVLSGGGFESDNFTVGMYTVATGTSVSGGGSTTPDIVSPNNATGSGGFNLLSNVAGGTTFNNRFDGGTLKVDAGTGTNATFSITRNKGYIDQNGRTATFSGVISNDGSDSGRLVILNTGGRTGRVVLSANNTYSGGTEVQAGAVLEIASAAALGTGRLDLVGSATVPATLSVTQTTTIANAITVAGDPVFNIASGTTTTITSPITDGSIAGDVVLTGGGTLALTAANTYTGPTTISDGTLRLAGAGSIANSNAVTNNATFDVTQATGNVSLGGTYAQGATGTLAMTLAPTANQQVNVAGTASLGGTLDVTAAAGTYRAGRYTLLTSTGLGGSTFAALSTNLPSVTAHTYRLAYDPNNVYLELRANAADTTASIQAMANDLNKVYNAQYSLAQLGLSYDCKLFDENNLCVSAGARTTHMGADGLASQALALIGAYRARADLRLGGWIDQNRSQHSSANVQVAGGTPMVGAFGVWNENPATGEGLEVRVSAAYGKRDLQLNRPVVGTSEAGQGRSTLSTGIVEAAVGYGLNLAPALALQPYAALRQARQSATGYTEATGPFSPLTFATTTQSTRSVLAGAKLEGKPMDGQSVRLELNAGVEHFMNTRSARMQATGIDGLSGVPLAGRLSANRPFTSAGITFDVAKNQQLLLGVSRAKPFASAGWASSGVIRYIVGL